MKGPLHANIIGFNSLGIVASREYSSIENGLSVRESPYPEVMKKDIKFRPLKYKFTNIYHESGKCKDIFEMTKRQAWIEFYRSIGGVFPMENEKIVNGRPTSVKRQFHDMRGRLYKRGWRISDLHQ